MRMPFTEGYADMPEIDYFQLAIAADDVVKFRSRRKS